MGDLYVGFAILTALSLACFRAALVVSDPGRVSRSNAIAAGVVLLMTWYTFHLWHSILITQLLPFSNVVIVGNWFPPAAAFLAGLTWQRLKEQHNRRGIMIGALTLAGCYSMVHPILGEHPKCVDRWHGNVCLQTSPSTCSAASAATLLKAHGIESTEHEMADLCLTRHGTTWTGLYRGLKRKTAGTPWDVEVFQCTLEDLCRNQSDPVILSVGIPDAKSVDQEYIDDWGWIPGQSHSVVLMRFLNPNTAVVGDPAIGSEVWSRRDLTVLWHGEGIRLVPRQSEFHLATRNFESR